ncbi:hypothetical protein PIROE2DRAFT_43594 [Piromyces sp. E2]|nr:hypothetical protein PIROE2DRAFT_43594 [Piromyces sp. E2]|eukprot:OUM63156.1 hypothetical protein PIROE2DRAFT_43594 [Piromyces sp. E2]
MESQEFQKFDPNIKDINGEYPIIAALHSNESTIFEYLLEHGADSNTKNLNENTLLSQAIHNNQYNIVKTLLKYNADIMDKDINNNYPLIKAILANEYDIVQLIIMHGIKNKINLNCWDVNGNTPLTLAYRQGFLEIFRLLAKFLDINMKDRNGNNSLYYVVLNKDKQTLQILKDLMSNGLDIDIMVENGNTLLAQAIIERKISIIDYLLDNGANIHSINNQGKSIIHLCDTYLKNYNPNTGFIANGNLPNPFKEIHLKIHKLHG